MKLKNELSSTGIQTYLYLIKTGKPVGPREVMRGAKLTSPSVAYRNLQKLIDLNLVEKDNYGNYLVKKIIGIKGYIWIGKKLLPRFIMFGFLFLIVLVIEIGILIPHLLAKTSVERSFWLLTVLTIISAGMFLVEGIKWKKTKLSI